MRRPPAELREFLEPYDPEVVSLFLAARRTVLTAAPRANELVYAAPPSQAKSGVQAVYARKRRAR